MNKANYLPHPLPLIFFGKFYLFSFVSHVVEELQKRGGFPYRGQPPVEVAKKGANANT